MPRHPPILAAVSVLGLLLFGCGNPSSESADQASQEDNEAIVETAAPDETEELAAVEEQDAAEYDEGSEDERQPDQPRRAGGPRVPRQAATTTVGAGVRGDIGMFYAALDRDGAWVRHPDYSYVWIPSRMGPGWRPYQEGRWIWTNDYGWYWESEEPFAWAVYHYGRWDYDPDYGWFWVPGDTWAPAWVTWRFGGNSVGWAPVAPDQPGFASGPPRRYAAPIAESWVFVDARDFADPDLGSRVLPVSRIGPSLHAATDIRTPRYENGRVTNVGARREEMQRLAGERIETREIVYVGDRNDMFEDVSGRRVGIYRPVITEAKARRAPPSVVEVTRTERIIVREYTQGAPLSGYDVPSAALLDVLDVRERRGLLEVRLTAQEAAVDQRIKQLRKERAALLKARQEEAARLETKLEKQRRKAMAERRQNQERLRTEKRQRAADIKVDTQDTEAATDAKNGGAKSAKQDAAPAKDAAVPELASPKTKAKAPVAPAPIETEAPTGDVVGKESPIAEPPAADLQPQPAPAMEVAPEPAPAPKQVKESPPPPPVPPAARGTKTPGMIGEEGAEAAGESTPTGAPDRAPQKKRKAGTPLDAEALPPVAVPSGEEAPISAPEPAPVMRAPAAETPEAATAPSEPSPAAEAPKGKKGGRAQDALEATTEASPAAEMPAPDPAPVDAAPEPPAE